MTAPERIIPLQSHVLARLPGIAHGFSERTGGVSPAPYTSLNFGARGGDAIGNVRENRRRFFAALGMSDGSLAIPRQNHSAMLHVVDGTEDLASLVGDGVITAVPGVALMVLAADCVPVLIADPVQRVVAAVHAGWRGVAGGIAARAVQRLAAEFGACPGDVMVALGPAIGPCCYEVGSEVIAAVAEVTPAAPEQFSIPGPRGRPSLNLHAAIAAQLRGCGVPTGQIDTLSDCTSCANHRFFSHRREGAPAGRGAAVITLTTT